jgi:predicted HAD superfamily Cof-like phosphohydrolase
MNRQHNKISVGGNVGGNVVAGSHNVVGPAPERVVEQPMTAPPEGLTPRLGFVVDIVEFGRRGAEGKNDLQYRLDTLVGQVIADIGVDPGDTECCVAGDAKVVFLPVGADSSRALPGLIAAMAERLKRDNSRFRDRLRLRMSAGTGLLGNGPLGFTGELIVDLHRLVDSEVCRQAVKDNPRADLVIVVAHALHDEVIRPGYLNRGDFTRVEVAMKEFTATAWLRVC